MYRAFTMHSADDARVPGENIETLIGHEYLHTWIPARFGSMGGEDEEPLHYWFSEGFTDFYTHRLRLRADPAALVAYAAVQNQRIRGYLTSPARNADNRVVRRSSIATRSSANFPTVAASSWRCAGTACCAPKARPAWMK